MDSDIKKILKWEYIGIIVTLVSFVVFDYFPKIVEVKQMHEIIKQAETNKNKPTQVQNEQQKAAVKRKLEQLEKGFSYINNQVTTAKKKMLKEKNVPIVTLEIEDLASTSEIELASIRPAGSQEKQGIEVLPINLGFRSDFYKILDFLSRIDNSSACLVVQRLNISKEEMSYPVLNVQLTLNILYDLKPQGGGQISQEDMGNAK